MACTFDGWIGQLSVQATDFSILAISLATLTVVLQKHSAAEASLRKKTLICLSVWVVPLITSTVATSMGAMQPVGGNWCWIANNQMYVPGRSKYPGACFLPFKKYPSRRARTDV